MPTWQSTTVCYSSSSKGTTPSSGLGHTKGADIYAGKTLYTLKQAKKTLLQTTAKSSGKAGTMAGTYWPCSLGAKAGGLLNPGFQNRTPQHRRDPSQKQSS